MSHQNLKEKKLKEEDLSFVNLAGAMATEWLAGLRLLQKQVSFMLVLDVLKIWVNYDYMNELKNVRYSHWANPWYRYICPKVFLEVNVLC